MLFKTQVLVNNDAKKMSVGDFLQSLSTNPNICVNSWLDCWVSKDYVVGFFNVKG